MTGSAQQLWETQEGETQPRLVLASISPRRFDLLSYLGVDFEAIPSRIEENVDETLPPEVVVVALAKEKASAVFETVRHEMKPGQKIVVLGADTMVVHEGIFLNKPTSTEDAFAMLTRLSGNWHEVY